MKIGTTAWQSIWREQHRVLIIDQTLLPHRLEVCTLESLDQAVCAITGMQVRGAPLIGATAAYGVALAMMADDADQALARAIAVLGATRPTAVNLRWALQRMARALEGLETWSSSSHSVFGPLASAEAEASAIAAIDWPARSVQHEEAGGGGEPTGTGSDAASASPDALDRLVRGEVDSSRPLSPRQQAAWSLADAIAQEDVAVNRALGRHGAALLSRRRVDLSAPLQILTHCNAGWLATVDGGTALAPIYALHDAGVPVHVWVDETRPRNQGASLTAWELQQHGVPCTLVADNAGGLLMMQGRIDVVITGCDRVAANGDVANKIGTYLKALAAHAHGIPFYVACPLSTLDLSTPSGVAIPIETRSGREVTHISGLDAAGTLREVALAPEGVAAWNPGFDITPARLVTALITEHGVLPPQADALARVAREHRVATG